MKGRIVLARVLAFSALAALMGILPTTASASQKGRSTPTKHITHISPVRTVNLGQIAARAKSGTAGSGTLRYPKVPHHQIPKSGGGGTRFTVPNPANTAITTANGPNFHGHDGISGADSRFSFDGNQFSNEPSDMGLCTGGSYVLEVVNAALQVFSTSGSALTPVIAHNEFLGLPPSIDRTNGTFPGPSSGDGNCKYDPVNGHWFFETWSLDQDPTTGDLTLANWYYIAVSATSNPLGSWYIYKIDASSSFKPQCPCEGDHPFIGFDGNVFSISDNEFDFFTGQFYGAQLRLLSLADIEAGGVTPVVQIVVQKLSGHAAYTLQPANIPPGGSFETASGGALYYASALEFLGTGDNRIAIWALSNTQAINGNPALMVLKNRVIGSEVYFNPQKMQQKPGYRPLGNSVGEPRRSLDGGGDETQQTTFADGFVWTALDTLVGTPSTLRNGVAWFQVSVGLAGPSVLASVVNQGYVAVAGQNVDYGIVAARADGQAIISGTLVGPGYYPSTWYGFLHPGGADAVHVAGAGFLPQDGFTCYKAFVGDQFLRGCRWGDYSDAGVNADGNFYFSAEYVSSRAPGPFTNWGSFWSTTPPG